jgi:sulfide:quinone oxidoreductase
VRVSPRRPAQIVIAGGGVAAVESLLALRELAGNRVKVSVVSPEREFVYRPVTVAEAFGRGEARTHPLGEIVAHAGAELVSDSVKRVEPSGQAVYLPSGERIGYDRLIVAAGAVARESLPGALTFRGREDVPALRDLLVELASGAARSVALTLPSERMWTLPIYELVGLLETFDRK